MSKVIMFYATVLLCPWQSVFATERPNIVFVLTDDQPFGYMGVTGNAIVNTPNLDELANQGVLFTNAHVTSAICTPSRASILLSQYERKHSVNFNSGTSVSAEAWQDSYPVQLGKAGYYTGWIGKNHVPVGKQGYETGLMEQSIDYWYAGHGHLRFYPKQVHDIFSEAKKDTQIEIMSEAVEDFLSPNKRNLKKALSFLDARPTDRPFLLSINFNLPHFAGTSSMEMRESDDDLYKSKYRDVQIPLPKHYVAKKDITQPKLPPDLLRTKDRQNIYDYVDTPSSQKETTIRQMQAMEGIDRLLGKLRTELKQQGIEKNTIIVFTSDHGLFMGQFGLGGKALCYQQTTHVPLIIYDPRITSETNRSDALVQSIDIAPTLLSMAGVLIPESMQGEDLSPLLSSSKTTKVNTTQRQYLFSENLWSTHFGNPRCESIQDKNWKYIRYYKNNNQSATRVKQLAQEIGLPVGPMLYGVHDSDIPVYQSYLNASIEGEPAVYEELFDLTNDPEETTNVATKLKNKAILSTLREDWRTAVISARGKGRPKIERYTRDSQLQKQD